MRRAATLWVLILALGLGACATTEPTETVAPAALEEGVNVLEVGEGSLSLAFRQDATVVYLQALRGRPGAYPNDPDMPAFEVDARFVAENGVAFYVRQGGDDFVNESWAVDLQRQSDDAIAREDNQHLFLLGDEIARVLRQQVTEQLGAERAAALAPEIEALEESAADLSRSYERSRNTRLEHLANFEGLQVDGGGDVAFGTNGPEDAERAFNANFYYIAIHGACIASTLCVGRHSATRIYEWISRWSVIHDFCNHGDCASSMSQQSFLNFNEAVVDFKPSWTAQTCNTGYHWDSSNGGHNCHDDSRRQMMNFVYSRYPARNAYHCSDNTDTNRWVEPRSNGSRNWGYNHPWACQYNFSDDGAASCPSSYQGTRDGCDCGCRFPDGTTADPDCQP
jgi:hypothetical protein